jgi:hypothetical protein
LAASSGRATVLACDIVFPLLPWPVMLRGSSRQDNLGRKARGSAP